jgi:hypothetical protein
MKWVNTIIASFMLCVAGFSTANASVIYAAYQGSQQGISVRDSLTLNQINSFNVGFDINGIAAANGNEVLLSSGNTIYRYRNDGTLLNSFSWVQYPVTYTDVSVQNETLYASYTGGFGPGVTERDSETLGQSNFFNTGTTPSSVNDGLDNDLYMTNGNVISNYGTDGTFIGSMTFPNTGIVYTDSTTQGGFLVASYTGSQQGLTIRDADTYFQQYIIPLVFDVNGLDAGEFNDLYLAGGNSLYRYGMDGTLLNSFSWSDNTILYTDVAFQKVPTPAVFGLLGLGLAGLGVVRRRRLKK